MKHTHPRQGSQGKIDLLPTIQEKETVQQPLYMNSHFCIKLEPECHLHIFPTCNILENKITNYYLFVNWFIHSFIHSINAFWYARHYSRLLEYLMNKKGKDPCP